jgi:hypothetical protein
VDAAKEVFAYWRAKCGHGKAQWTRSREGALKARLREEPGSMGEKVAGLKLAVDGALLDPLFNGSEKGTPYLDFDNLFVNKGRNRIEKLQGIARRGPIVVAKRSPKAQAEVDVFVASMKGGLKNG